MEEQNVKKKLKIKLLPLLVFIIICLLLYLIITFLLSIRISNIYITGNNILSDQEIIELAGISDYPSFMKTTSWHLKKKLTTNSYIDSVKIKKSGLGTVIIEIKENIPLLIDLNGKLVLSNGNTIENAKKLSAPYLINYVPDKKYSELIKKLALIDTNILSKISEIKYETTTQDKDRFGLLMNDGNLVYVTLTKFSNLNYYNDIISGITCKKGIINLDSGNHFEIKEDYCSN